MEQSTGDLIGRLSRLELEQAKLQRCNKRLRLMTGAVMLICGALFTMAQTNSAVPETLEAQQFLLRDSAATCAARSVCYPTARWGSISMTPRAVLV
jgi:hypothetical protein